MGSITGKTTSAGTAIAVSSWQTDNDPYFSWTESTDGGSGMSGYYYAVGDDTPETDGTWKTTAEICSAGTCSIQLADNSLTDGKRTFYVRAVDNAGNNTGTPGSFAVWADTQSPGTPSTFTATSNQESNIDLSWSYADTGNDNVSSITEYKVERVTWADHLTGESWATRSSYKTYLYTSTAAAHTVGDGEVDEAITQGVKYAYRISSKDSAGNDYQTVSSIISGMTVDTVAPPVVEDVAVSPCDGTNNCSTKADIPHKGYENKITWSPSLDTGVGTSYYIIYRSSTNLTGSNYTDSAVTSSYKKVGVLPYVSAQSPQWYDNDANNDGTSTFYDGSGDLIADGPAGIKTEATDRLNDFVKYYYRIVAIDANGNPQMVNPFPEISGVSYDFTKSHQNGNIGEDNERTPDITAPDQPGNLNVTAMGLDSSGTAQRVDLTWDATPDHRTDGRIPTGDGSGISGYKVFQCQGNSEFCSNDNNYTQIATPSGNSLTKEGLEQFTQYSYKIVAVDSASSGTITDANNNNSVRSGSQGTMTASNAVPTVPDQVTVTAQTGDPNTNSQVGHKNTITFKGSYSQNCQNGTRCVVLYELYRSGDANTYTKLADLAISPIGDEREITYTYIDNADSPVATRSSGGGITVTRVARTGDNSLDTPDDAKSYYYKVKAKDNTPASPDGGPFISGFSAVDSGTPQTGGWDTTADSTKPNQPQGVAVKDMFGDGLAMGTEYARTLVSWQAMISADSQRNSSGDFDHYEVWRYYLEGGLHQDEHQDEKSVYVSPKGDFSKNYYVDAFSQVNSTRDYYYYVVTVDNAGTDYKYSPPNQTTIINGTSNISAHLSAVSINPSTTKPTVSNVSVPQKGVSSATITWTTNQATDSLVEYKIEGTDTVIATGKDRTQPQTEHSVALGNLAKGTTYQFRVISRNSLGNIDEEAAKESKFSEQKFTTDDFSITNPSVTTTTSTATVRWNTNINADSYVEYKLEGSQDKFLVAGDSTATTSHEVTIKSLRPNSRYTYNLRSVTSDNYIATVNLESFKTRDNDLDKFSIQPAETSVSEQNVTATTAQITWVTTTATTSWVEYGTEAGVYSMSSGDNDFNTLHAVKLNNLRPGTKYFYRVKGKDENGIELFSPESTFTAVLMPEITNLHVRDFSSYTATITFDTNVDAVVSLNYGKDTEYGSSVTVSKAEKNHVVTLKELDDNSTYHFQASAIDQFKNNVKSADGTFSTPLDTQGPEVSELKVDVLPVSESSDTASAIVSWTTDKPSTTLVEYDDKGSGEKYENHSTEDSSLNTSHTVMIKELNTSSNYRFRIVAKDKRENITKTKSSTFITPTKEKSLLQIIIKSLEDTFSWTKNIPSFFGRVGNRLMGK